MKIRIKGNSIRFRLTRTEVGTLALHGYLEEKTEFAANEFIYAIETRNDIKELSAEMVGNKLSMFVSEQMAKEWATNAIVGYDHTVNTGASKSLFLLLEKDFKCIDGKEAEEEPDTYDNPLISCK